MSSRIFFKLKYILLAAASLTLVILFLTHSWKRGWEEMSKMDCQVNMKQVSVLLHLYANKNDGWFPDKNGKEGLEMLRNVMWEEENLANSPFIFNCPNVHSESRYPISYDYIGGYKIDSDKDIGIIMDKEGNHNNFGNIGFVDGRVLSFSGKDWRKNANPPNPEAKNIKETWLSLLSQKGCFAGGEHWNQNSGEGSVFSRKEWKSFLDLPSSSTVPFLLEHLNSQKVTMIHVCPFHMATEGEVAVYALEHILKSNWFDCGPDCPSLTKWAEKRQKVTSPLTKTILNDPDSVNELKLFFLSQIR